MLSFVVIVCLCGWRPSSRDSAECCCSTDCTVFSPRASHSTEHHWTVNWCFSTINTFQFAFLNSPFSDYSSDGLQISLWNGSDSDSHCESNQHSLTLLDHCFPFTTQYRPCFIFIFLSLLVVFQPVLKRRSGHNKWAGEQQLGPAGCYYIRVFVCTNE